MIIDLRIFIFALIQLEFKQVSKLPKGHIIQSSFIAMKSEKFFTDLTIGHLNQIKHQMNTDDLTWLSSMQFSFIVSEMLIHIENHLRQIINCRETIW